MCAIINFFFVKYKIGIESTYYFSRTGVKAKVSLAAIINA